MLLIKRILCSKLCILILNPILINIPIHMPLMRYIKIRIKIRRLIRYTMRPLNMRQNRQTDSILPTTLTPMIMLHPTNTALVPYDGQRVVVLLHAWFEFEFVGLPLLGAHHLALVEDVHLLGSEGRAAPFEGRGHVDVFGDVALVD